MDFKAEIDSRCSGVLARLYKAQCGIYAYEVVGEHAEAINRNKYGTFFGMLQRMGLPTAVIELGAVYETEKRRHALDSLSGIIKYARHHINEGGVLAIDPSDLDHLHRDIGFESYRVASDANASRAYCDWLHDQLHNVLDLECEHSNTSAQLHKVRSGLRSTIHARDKFLAHAENPRYIKKGEGRYLLNIEAQSNSRSQGPSLEDMDHMIDWAGKALVLYWAVFSGMSVGISVRQSSSTARGSIQRVLRNLSVLPSAYDAYSEASVSSQKDGVG